MEYTFIGNGVDASETFDEVYDSEEAAIEAAKYEYDNDMEEHLGYLTENEDSDELCPIIDVCKVEDFDVDHAIKLGIENFKDTIADQYFDFESGIDDGDVAFSKGFDEEMFNAIKPIMDKHFRMLGIDQKCYTIRQVDLTKL